MTDWYAPAYHFVLNSGTYLISHLKWFEKVLLGLEDSYIELLTVLALGLLAVIPILAPAKSRQVWRHLTQVVGIVIFIFVVYTCMGVFGMISNFFRGFSQIGQENILALYFTSVPVTILVTSLLFGPFFCGWICPTGSTQEFIGLLTRKRNNRQKSQHYPFSWIMLFSSILLAGIFLFWLYQLSRTRLFFAEDATVYWAFIIVILLFLLTWKMWGWDGPLRKLKYLSFWLITGAAVLHIRVTSPVHFGFAKIVDPASILATVIVVIAALLIPRVWCRYLCPWRLAITWASKHSVRKIRFSEQKCTACGICTQVCDIEAIRIGRINPEECNMCLRCVDQCPEHALELQDDWQGGCTK